MNAQAPATARPDRNVAAPGLVVVLGTVDDHRECGFILPFSCTPRPFPDDATGIEGARATGEAGGCDARSRNGNAFAPKTEERRRGDPGRHGRAGCDLEVVGGVDTEAAVGRRG